MDVNIRLRELIMRRLDDLGWTRTDLARRMGTSPEVVYDHMSGRKGFSGATLTKYLDALGVELRFETRDAAPRNRKDSGKTTGRSVRTSSNDTLS